MSAFISIASPDMSVLITDGATYDRNGIVTRLGSKVTLCPTVSLAVTTRGNAQVGQALADVICREAGKSGAAVVIDQLQSFANLVREAHGTQLEGANEVQVLVAAYVPGRGGVHRFFSTASGSAGFEIEPYVVIEPPAEFIAGPYLDEAVQEADGIPMMLPHETMAGYFGRVGVDFMEAMRRIPAEGAGYDGKRFVIGGQCDLTTLTADGAKTKTVRVWPEDHVGFAIDPLQTVAPPTGNRAQRRAARALMIAGRPRRG
jgi:hypothetical protein